MADMDQKDSTHRALVVNHGSGMCSGLVLLVILHLPLYFSSSCRMDQMLGIFAGMDQIDSDVVRFWRTRCSWFRLQETVDFPQLQSIKVVDILRGSEAHLHGRCDHRDSPVARGYGGRCPFVAGRAVLPCRGAPWSRLFVRPSGFPSCTCTRCSMPCYAGPCGIPMVSLTLEVLQFFIDKVIVAPIVQVERVLVPS